MVSVVAVICFSGLNASFRFIDRPMLMLTDFMKGSGVYAKCLYAVLMDVLKAGERL